MKLDLHVEVDVPQAIWDKYQAAKVEDPMIVLRFTSSKSIKCPAKIVGMKQATPVTASYYSGGK